MDRHALEFSLRAASARVALGAQALLKQRQHIRELERYGLDSGTAKALLRQYEQSQAMNLFDRDCFRQALEHEADSSEYDAFDLYYLDRKAA